MGSAVGRRLRDFGVRVITELNGRSRQSAQRVADARLEVIETDELLVREADLVLSIVPPGVAREVAERFYQPLSRANRKPVFVDCNAISPATVRGIRAILAETGCGFADAGIIGGPPPASDLSKGPRFYASGPDAHHFARLGQHGLDIVLLDGPVGAASALKLAYAGLTKGFTALGTAMISAASREGLAEALRAELARTQPDMLVRFDRSLPAMFAKAHRWVAEMEEIAELAGSADQGATIYQGVARLYERIAAEFCAESSRQLADLTRFCSRRG